MSKASSNPIVEAPRGLAILRLAFRPFYLLAALAASVSMPLWLAVFTGRVHPAGGLPPVLWHAHEMVFGIVAAVIVGFLFTAGKTWTGLPTPRGGQLLTLVLLWLAARGAAVLGPPPVFFLLDIVFLPLSAAFFAEILRRGGSRRNYGIAGLLGVLGLVNLGFHLSLHSVMPVAPIRFLHGGLCTVVLIESIIGGRVIPAFTRNAVPGIRIELPAWLERSQLAVTLVALLLWLLGAPHLPTAATLAAAGALHAWRLGQWKPLRTGRKPLLWSLHLAYAWIPTGLLMLAWSSFNGTAASPALHGLAVGATGGLLIAMMTRTARGHTGRPLQASRAETCAYLLVASAALLRVLPPLLWPSAYAVALLVAGACFSTAFLIYVIVFGPWLVSTRRDGKDG